LLNRAPEIPISDSLSDIEIAKQLVCIAKPSMYCQAESSKQSIRNNKRADNSTENTRIHCIVINYVRHISQTDFTDELSVCVF